MVPTKELGGYSIYLINLYLLSATSGLLSKKAGCARRAKKKQTKNVRQRVFLENTQRIWAER